MFSFLQRLVSNPRIHLGWRKASSSKPEAQPYLPPTPPLSTDDLKSSARQASPVPLEQLHGARWERKMGDSELSYYLPSREDGVNDMYLHLGFSAPPRLLRRERVAAIWALMRLRHPLLAAVAEMRDYDDVRFVRFTPVSAGAALAEAECNLEYRTQSSHELIDSYLNGPRTLSNERLSYLIVSEPGVATHAGLLTPPPTPMLDMSGPPVLNGDRQYEVLICAAHFIGDGMALHNFANDFFRLLASEKTQEDLERLVEEEWTARCGNISDDASFIPVSLEARLPDSQRKLRDAIGRVEFQQHQRKDIGGHSFARVSGKPRHTVVPTVSFDEARTKAVLKRCKGNGVSISAALFAACNVAWARCGGAIDKPELPTMMYSALNLRPYFKPAPSSADSFWFLACGYFNVVLPTFLPSSGSSEDQARTFWHRARAAKAQSAAAAKSVFVVSRTKEMARVRGVRARAWGREDDEKANGTWVPPTPAPASTASQSKPADKAPNTALMGLSLLGNLDGIYKHAEWPALKMNALTTGSRQRSGGMLMFGYTFAGKLYVSLGYDEEGLKKTQVEAFWVEVLKVMDEFLLA